MKKTMKRTMKRTLLLALALSGLTAPSSGLIREYHHVQLRKSWSDAQSYCREAFTDLAAVEDQSDSDRLLSVLRGPGAQAWIGLHDNKTGWRWALGEEDFLDDYTNWSPGQPNHKNYNQSCLTMTSSGQWLDRECRITLPAICYYDKGPAQFILVEAQMTWHEARAYCRSRYTDLASVRSRSENTRISSLVTVYTWVGLHRTTWAYWSDRTPNTFSNWNQGQPNIRGTAVDSCAAVGTGTGLWWDVDCRAENTFVCQKVYSRQRQTFRLRLRSKADLKDPAVQQQILDQLHQKLEQHGLDDFKLRWMRTLHREQEEEEEGTVCFYRGGHLLWVGSFNRTFEALVGHLGE
ncbi:C-type mannose receptor 2-like [Pseudoliparis swirei]|uniref:C-type mannose receptor 2-like n=1 Tax=Pseudoliparis swirei TaxID=2059687 RepID=UPI0024BE9555|nr:C-type mannose receptor 2-like [Pseudoliparis swirei]